MFRAIAQGFSVQVWGTWGRRFKSGWPEIFFKAFTDNQIIRSFFIQAADGKILINEKAGTCTALPDAGKRPEPQPDSSIILYTVPGVNDMCDVIQKLVNEERVSAKAEEKTAMVKEMLRKGTIPAKDIADISGLTISEVSALAEEL